MKNTESSHAAQVKPWPALWTMVLGFFMILVDTTIVAVANPSIMEGLHTTMVNTLWATSAYLLAYAVPLLITGRLGDRFGPRKLYLAGLGVFTLASLACGLSPTIELLIVARAVQGLGAAMLTPQTMAVITRIFPQQQRGSAMAVWGITAGVAMLVGPILGGFLLDAWGWEWIFFINVPVGVIAFALAVKFVPRLETHPHRLDWFGVLLSAAGMFMVVFGIQEGESYHWGTIWGPISVWGLIIGGVLVLGVFVLWQAKQRGEPLLPLGIFTDRNFSLGTAIITTVGIAVTSMSLPLMFYFQLVRGLTPTQSALMLLPMAVLSAGLARPIGTYIDRRDPRFVSTLGMLLLAVGLAAYALWLTPESPLWLLLVPGVILGVANACMWAPLAAMTMYSLPPKLAGAGSGVYNTTRQVGAVLGSAVTAVLMQVFVTAQFGSAAAQPAGEGAGGGVAILPEPLREGFSTAMAQTLVMPIAVSLVGAVLTLGFASRRTILAAREQHRA